MALALQQAEGALRPPLKWAGGKRWLVPQLLKIWTPHARRRLVEPFVGGLAVTLGLSPKRALLNDVNPHLISFYTWLQRGLDPTTADVELANDREVYEANRERFNELIRNKQESSSEAAVLFYYLNRTGFNGLCRFNASGYFNVPFGRYKSINYRLAYQFRDYVRALSPYTFTRGDFEALNVTAADFVYADPPYDTPFTQYSAGGFGWGDQERLARWLAAHTGPVVASNQATPRILRLYRSLGFEIAVVDAPRRISCDGNRDAAREMIARKNI